MNSLKIPLLVHPLAPLTPVPSLKKFQCSGFTHTWQIVYVTGKSLLNTDLMVGILYSVLISEIHIIVVLSLSRTTTMGCLRHPPLRPRRHPLHPRPVSMATSISTTSRLPRRSARRSQRPRRWPWWMTVWRGVSASSSMMMATWSAVISAGTCSMVVA